MAQTVLAAKESGIATGFLKYTTTNAFVHHEDGLPL